MADPRTTNHGGQLMLPTEYEESLRTYPVFKDPNLTLSDYFDGLYELEVEEWEREQEKENGQA